MIIEEIDEKNFMDRNEEGQKRVDLKIRKLERQIEVANLEAKNNQVKVEDKTPINWNLFLDPTIWAYKFLRDKQNNPLILRGYQDKIINDRHRFIVCVAANQVGKTWAMCVKALHHAIFASNASVLIVSKSEQQAIMILDEITWMMRRANIRFDTMIDEVENRTELQITNVDKKGVSVIRCLPPTKRVLAYPATLIICDEIGFWEIDKMDSVDFFEQVIVSRTLETKNWKNDHFTMGQIVCISNPNAQQGALWYLWNNPEFHQYRFNFLSNPNNTIGEYEAAKRTKPSDIFDSVYAAVFSSSAGGFVTGSEYQDAIRDYSVFPPPNIVICLGGDFAGEDTKSRDVDFSVLFGGIRVREEKVDKVKVVYYKEFPPRTKKALIYEEIKRLKPSHFAYDKAGVGDSVKNDLIDNHILSEYQIESLTYSLPNKSEVYYNMKHLFEQRKIIIPDLAKLKEQLLGLRFEKTEGGHIKVHHQEGFHDDWADALANCCWATIRSSGVPVDLTVIKTEKDKKIKPKKSGELSYCDDCKDYHWGDCDDFE